MENVHHFIVFGIDSYNQHLHIANATDEDDAMKQIEELENRYCVSMFAIYKNDHFNRSILNVKCPAYSHYRNVAHKQNWRGQPALSLRKCLVIEGKYYFQ